VCLYMCVGGGGVVGREGRVEVSSCM
jgi:hypothetical protein